MQENGFGEILVEYISLRTFGIILSATDAETYENRYWSGRGEKYTRTRMHTYIYTYTVGFF